MTTGQSSEDPSLEHARRFREHHFRLRMARAAEKIRSGEWGGKPKESNHNKPPERNRFLDDIDGSVIV